MYGRMVHSYSSRTHKLTQESQSYDAHGRFIRAADRSALNKALISELAGFNNVKLFFEHKLTGADFDRGRAWIENQSITHADYSGKQRPEEIEINFDLMIGADGAHSAVRFHMMKFARVSYQQEYIDTLWCEFHIKPRHNETMGLPEFAISPNHLHIWPTPQSAKEPMMFIAIPSSDKSFTCTLFAHPNTFASFTPQTRADTCDSKERETAARIHKQRLVSFFRTNFPGVTPDLIPEEDLVEQFHTNPHLPLISIKCTPHHYSSRTQDSGVVILGDAAHAMVPFYGQGMNAGLEDVRVLFDIMDASSTSRPDVEVVLAEQKQTVRPILRQYTHSRKPAAHAIVDLSMRNFVEMREGVTSPMYLMRKRVEEWLSVWFPKYGWATQYARVSFSDESYDSVVKEVEGQGRMLKKATWMGSVIAGGGVVASTAWAWRRLVEKS